MQHPLGLNRLEGRLFNDAGHMCLVVEADESTGSGRVSFQADGVRHVMEMPLIEISRLVSHSSGTAANKVENQDLSHRVKSRADGFYASAREGSMGPFPTFAAAEAALREHIETSLLSNSPAR